MLRETPSRSNARRRRSKAPRARDRPRSASSRGVEGARSQKAGQNQIGDLLALCAEVVGLLGEDPGGHHLIEDSEDRLGHELRMHVAAEAAFLLAVLDDAPDDVEVVLDL